MALIIRSAHVRPLKPVCTKDCKDRKQGCHSNCERYIEWAKNNMERKKQIRQYNLSTCLAEDYEIKERQKNIAAKKRRKGR